MLQYQLPSIASSRESAKLASLALIVDLALTRPVISPGGCASTA